MSALREQLKAAEGRALEVRQVHAKEIAECDQQSAKLRQALHAIEGRLELTEGALKAAKETATRAEGVKSRALVERAESTRIASELQQLLDDANARLSSLGVGIIPQRTPRDWMSQIGNGEAPPTEPPPLTAPAHGMFAGAPPPPPPSSARPVTVQLMEGGTAAGNPTPLSDGVGPLGGPRINRIDMSGLRTLEAELDHDLLLSQRALDFFRRSFRAQTRARRGHSSRWRRRRAAA